MQTLPLHPTKYSAEIVRSDGDRTRVYVNGWKRRVELYYQNGQTSIVISRPDKGLLWNLTPQTRTYSQSKLRPRTFERMLDPEMLYEWTAKGHALIDGRRCIRFVGIYRDAKGPVGKAREICYIDAKTGIRRREVSFDMKGKVALTIDCLNVTLGPPAPEVFRLPEGYKRGYHKRKR